MARRFPNLIFLKILFWVNLCVFPLSALLRVLLTFSPCCLSILCYVLLVTIFYSSIFQFLLHPVVGIIINIMHLRNFPHQLNRWLFTGICVIARLLTSLGTLLSILVDFSNEVAWRNFFLSLINSWFRLLSRFLLTALRARNIIGITVTSCSIAFQFSNKV